MTSLVLPDRSIRLPRFGWAFDGEGVPTRALIPPAVLKLPRLERDEVLRRLGIVPALSGGSFVSGTVTDLLFANVNDGTAITAGTFSVETTLLGGFTGTIQPWLPPSYLANMGLSKSLLIMASGVMSSAATPTITFFIRIGQTIAVVTGTSIGQSVAMTAANTTNSMWQAQLVITRRTPGMGAGAATWAANGFLESPGVASPFWYALTPAASATAWTFTMDDTQTQYINLSGLASANSASNSMQCKSLLMFGCN